MSSLAILLAAYLLGGLTFLPLLLAAIVYFYSLPAPLDPNHKHARDGKGEVEVDDDDVTGLSRPGDDKAALDSIRRTHAQETLTARAEQKKDKENKESKESKERKKAHHAHHRHHQNLDDSATAGYFAVFRKYVAIGVNSKPLEASTVGGPNTVAPPSPSVYQTFFRGMLNKRGGSSSAGGADSSADAAGAAGTTGATGTTGTMGSSGTTGTTGTGSVHGGSGSAADEDDGGSVTVEVSSAASPRPKNARNMFYVVLRHGHLILFDDDQQVDVRHVIKLADHDVGVYAGSDSVATPEGELFIKRNALRLAPRHPERVARAHNAPVPQPWFFYSDNCSEKEDFYFALLRSQSQERHEDLSADRVPVPRTIDVRHLTGLMERLHASEEAAEMRWLNALIGRLFLGVYRTPEVLRFITDKVVTKLSRAPRPGFVASIAVQRVELGESTPQITLPRLKSLTADGECIIEADVRYTGHFAMDLAATMRVSTPIGQQEVKTSLAVALTRLEGHILFKIKAPPSNRIWFSFRHMPKLEMEVRPIILARQLTWPLVIQMIEGRIKEAIAESIVLPFWDDMPFFSTEHKRWRGGVWADDTGLRRSHSRSKTAATSHTGDGMAVDEGSTTTTGPSDSPAVRRLRRLSQNMNPPAVVSTTTPLKPEKKPNRQMEGPSLPASDAESPSLPQRLSSRPMSGLAESTTAAATGTDGVPADVVKASASPAASGKSSGAVSTMARLSRSRNPTQYYRTSSASSESGGIEMDDSELVPGKGELSPVTEARSGSRDSGGGGDTESEATDGQSTRETRGQYASSLGRASSVSQSARSATAPAAASMDWGSPDDPGSRLQSVTTIITGGPRSSQTASWTASRTASPNGSGKRGATLAAAMTGAAATAKRWGINALQRRAAAAAERKAQQGSGAVAGGAAAGSAGKKPLERRTSTGEAVDLSKPMGGGRPLPPPGEPLPMPGEIARARSASSSLASSLSGKSAARKPVLPTRPTSQPRSQDHVTDTTGELSSSDDTRRRRHVSMMPMQQDDVFVVQAPVEEEEEEEEEEEAEAEAEADAKEEEEDHIAAANKDRIEEAAAAEETKEATGYEEDVSNASNYAADDDGLAAWDVDYSEPTGNEEVGETQEAMEGEKKEAEAERDDVVSST